MKVLVIPDVHGSVYWKSNVHQYFQESDLCVFLGDYINSFNDKERGIYANNNLKEIIELKKTWPDKVTLLIGNHDLAHTKFCHANNPYISGYEYHSSDLFDETFYKNRKYFQIAVSIDGWVFSHAGITKTWFKWAKQILKMRYPNQFQRLPRDPAKFANLLWKKEECGVLDFNRGGDDVYGDDPIQGPLWIRLPSLLKDAYYDKQFVGHTEVCNEKPVLLRNEKNAVICLDSRSHSLCYVLDTNKLVDKSLEVKSISNFF